jgi:phosphoribosylformylglycinamidine synthase
LSPGIFAACGRHPECRPFEEARPLYTFASAPYGAAFMKANVIVMPKQSVLDPQGVAVRDAIHHHGFSAVKQARVGKLIELELDGTHSEAQLHEVCRDLLSNPVIEDYRLEIQD